LAVEEDYEPEYADSTSEQFAAFAARFERLMKDFILFVLGIPIRGVQVIALREGSVEVSFLVLNDPAESGVNSTYLMEQLNNPTTGVTSINGLNINASKPVKTSGANPCKLLNPCDDDHQCIITGDAIDTYRCECIKDADGNCRKDAETDWLIAVIVVASLVGVLIILITFSLIRMYRKRGTRYSFKVGVENPALEE